MAIPIIIPRLGWNMEEGTFLGWLKEDGAPVRSGDAIFRLESDKATEDIECLDSGILRIAPGGPKEGDRVPVGLAIGQLEGELQGEDSGSQIATPVTALAEANPQSSISNLQSPVNPRPTNSKTQSPVSSPRARRVAAEMGVDWTKLQGSGRDGRVRERDVRLAAPTSMPGSAEKIIPLTSLRRASAERLVISRQSTVPVTLTTTCNATKLIALRRQFQATNKNAVPSLTDFFVKLTALALVRHPHLAARWADDHLVQPSEINIGIAVDTAAGLLVPVIHQVPSLPLSDLAARSRDLIERARQGKLTTKDMQGGVFTVTNLGMFGIDAFTPIINYPECAILGIGCIRRVPVFVDDKVAAQDQITLSLTFDHRIVDGVPAARFLQTLTQALENPEDSL